MIRTAQMSDIEDLSELAQRTYAEAFGHSFLPEDLAAHLQKHLSPENFACLIEREVILVAEIEGELVGYVQFGAADPSDTKCSEQELRRLYVDSAFQNQGTGTALIKAALDHPHLRGADTITLDVWEHNPGAQRFYQRHGFEIVGTRSFEVESGAPTSLDYIMIRRSTST